MQLFFYPWNCGKAAWVYFLVFLFYIVNFKIYIFYVFIVVLSFVSCDNNNTVIIFYRFNQIHKHCVASAAT
ncbi:hypothetical protein D0S45_05575 [Marinifilum sp. JC120]|nr:hypothetical protein D0S45_05575 [Marinifilum sp. JC120]